MNSPTVFISLTIVYVNNNVKDFLRTIVNFFLTGSQPPVTLTIVCGEANRREVNEVKKFNPAMLIKRRKELGMTQRALAYKACLSVVSVSHIENARKEPRAGTMARLAQALRCNVDYFFSNF